MQILGRYQTQLHRIEEDLQISLDLQAFMEIMPKPECTTIQESTEGWA